LGVILAVGVGVPVRVGVIVDVGVGVSVPEGFGTGAGPEPVLPISIIGFESQFLLELAIKIVWILFIYLRYNG